MGPRVRASTPPLGCLTTLRMRCSPFVSPAMPATSTPPGAMIRVSSSSGGSISPWTRMRSKVPASRSASPSAHWTATPSTPKAAEPRAGFDRERAEALDGQDVRAHVAEQRGRVARAGPDLEGYGPLFHLQRFNHQRERRRRRRGLAAADRQRDVARGDVGEALRQEQRARRQLHRPQQRKIADAPGAQPQQELRAFFRFLGRAACAHSAI